MKNCSENLGLLSNGRFSTLDWPTHEMIAAAHRERGKALREMTSALYHRLWFFLASSPLLSNQARREDDVAARYVGDRWCDTSERKLNDELMAGHRGSFMP